MKRSQRLNPVVEMAKKATEAELVKVGEANTLWNQDRQQLEDLKGYKGEYLLRFRQGDQMAMSAQKVMELRAFLAQLDQAIAAQEQQVSKSLMLLQRQQESWKQVRSKEQAMGSLVDRYQKEETRSEVRQEQNDNDERNTAQWLRRSK